MSKWTKVTELPQNSRERSFDFFALKRAHIISNNPVIETRNMLSKQVEFQTHWDITKQDLEHY